MINPSRITRSTRLRIKLQSMKICAHQIVKKSEIEKKSEGPLSGRETFVEYFIFSKDRRGAY